MNLLHNQSGLCKAAKRLYGAKAPPHRAGPRSCPASIPYGQDIKITTPSGVVIFMEAWGFNMLGRNEFALRRGFAYGKTLVRRKSAAPLCGPRFRPGIYSIWTRQKEGHDKGQYP